MMKLSHLPARLAVGAFILNSGLNKRHLPEEAAAGLQQMAEKAFPQISRMSPAEFGTFISNSEISLGAALLTPFVPSWLAGAGLAVFSGSMVRMYLNTPGMTESDGIRPTSDGTALAKDFWMLGIAGTLVLDDLLRRRQKRK